MPSSPPLRLAVLGVGNIGSAFAFQLARAGHDVTVVARPGSPRLQQLQRDKGIVDIKGERADVRIADALDEETPYDLVIVTLLAHRIDPVLLALQRSRAKCIQFMFNTFEPERLGEAVGAERAAFGMPFIQSLLTDDGKLKATIGAMGQKSIMNQQRWVDVFKGSGAACRSRARHDPMATLPRAHVRRVRECFGGGVKRGTGPRGRRQ